MPKVTVGVLVDVSGSMQNSIGDEVQEEGGTWAQSVFKVIDDLITHDVSNDNVIFALGFGGIQKIVVDILWAIKEGRDIAQELVYQEILDEYENEFDRCQEETVESVFEILEKNGARTIRKWTSHRNVQEAVTDKIAQLLLQTLSSNSTFARKFVDDYLPDACKNWRSPEIDVRYVGTAVKNTYRKTEDLYSSTLSTFRQATAADIKDVVRKALNSEEVKKEVGNKSAEMEEVDKKTYLLYPALKEQFENDRAHALTETIENIFQTLETSGARTIRQWISPSTLADAVNENIAQCILTTVRSNPKCTRKLIDECLPSSCKDWKGADNWIMGSAVNWAQSTYASQASWKATLADVEELVGKTKALADIRASVRNEIKEQFKQMDENNQWRMLDTKIQKDITPKISIQEPSKKSLFMKQDASNTIHGCVDENKLTNQRTKELLKIVEPFIYGGTPLFTALREALKLFQVSAKIHGQHRRLLFIMSDGDAADRRSNDDDVRIKEQLDEEDVTVVCCYVQQSDSVKVEPRRLFSDVDESWEKGAKCLFNLSSTVATELVIRDVFFKKERTQWTIDIDRNETRLFAHVNHPDHIKDVCDLARDVVSCGDTLADLLVSVDLDIYINQHKAGFNAQRQEHNTCYANAIATVVHLAIHRTPRRNRPSFEELRDEIIEKGGAIEEGGSKTFRLLRKQCGKYNLKYEWLGLEDDGSIDSSNADRRAMAAITAKRSVLVRFELTADEWRAFNDFFQNNPTGILDKRHIDTSKRKPPAKTSGHAVVLTSFNSKCFYFMNSWGDDWGDKGFFRVASTQMLGMRLFDVHWNLDEYNEEDRASYQFHASEVANKLMTSLKALQIATFPCPKCSNTSNVTDFKGITLSEVECPKCGRRFSSKNVDGNILALSIHLKSLGYQYDSDSTQDESDSDSTDSDEYYSAVE